MGLRAVLLLQAEVIVVRLPAGLGAAPWVVLLETLLVMLLVALLAAALMGVQRL